MAVTRPGTQVVFKQSVPSPVAPSDTGTAFVIGIASAGPTNKSVLCRNIDDVTKNFGPRIPTGSVAPVSPLWDWCDVAFRSGVSKIYVGRVAGPAAAPATKTLNDVTPAASLTVTSNGPGPSTLKVGVVAGTVGGTVQIVVTDSANNIIDQSPNLATVADAVAWATYNSKGYVNIAAAGANLPVVVAAATLTGGSDDRASVTDAIRIAALPTLFPKALGAGQVACSGSNTAVMNAGLTDFCATVQNRTALIDGPDSSVAATVQAAKDAWVAACTQPLSETYGMFSAPWRVVPGNGGPYSRTVAPSAVIAGLIATSDGKYANPNLPAAGANGVDAYSLGSSQPEWSDSDRTSLNAGGVACFASIYGEQRLYGFRSGAKAKDVDSASYAWVSFAASRLRMAIAQDFDVIGQVYLFTQLDGQGISISKFNGAITGKLLEYWGKGALYGLNSSDAFIVDTGPSINTPDSIAAMELHAKIGLKTSPFNELSYFEATKVALTEELAA